MLYLVELDKTIRNLTWKCCNELVVWHHKGYNNVQYQEGIVHLTDLFILLHLLCLVVLGLIVLIHMGFNLTNTSKEGTVVRLQCHLTVCWRVLNYWIGGKQCRPWSDAVETRNASDLGQHRLLRLYILIHRGILWISFCCAIALHIRCFMTGMMIATTHRYTKFAYLKSQTINKEYLTQN